jgi:type I restriction enzyme S subunit
MVPFAHAVRDSTGGNCKVMRKDYLQFGDLPVIDQGQDFIAGYTEANNGYDGPLPVVLFGDHTRIFKYIDFPFALGADGVKVLEPKEGFDAKFLHFYLRSINIPSAYSGEHEQ